MAFRDETTQPETFRAGPKGGPMVYDFLGPAKGGLVIFAKTHCSGLFTTIPEWLVLL